MRPYINLTPTPSDQPLNDAQPSSQPQTADEYIHNFSNIEWQMEDEPPLPAHPRYPKLYHLLTITGQLLIAYYPHATHTLGEHFLAWAPLTSEPTVIIH